VGCLCETSSCKADACAPECAQLKPAP
jgi:hypothetical protein